MSHHSSVAPSRAGAGHAPAFPERFRFIKPTLPPLEGVLAAYTQSFASGMITNGPLVERFEQAAAERLNARHCVAVSSCTSGLILAMRVLGLSGEVILPSFTFFATGHAVAWNGLRPVFADVDPATWTIDPADVERKITDRTTAVIGVHLYGNPCMVKHLEELAVRRNLKLIFDSAHAFGSLAGGRAVGQFGDAEVFSLSPTKLLVAGEGGLVSTNDATLARLLRAARNYGDSGDYDPAVRGLNARMPEFNAALGLAGLEMVEQKVERHNAIATMYTQLLSGLPGVRFQHVADGNLSTYKDYSILLDGSAALSRDALAAQLLADNIETKKYFYPPLHQQKLYAPHYDGSGLSHTEAISSGVLSLPIYHGLDDDTVSGVARAIRRLLA